MNGVQCVPPCTEDHPPTSQHCTELCTTNTVICNCTEHMTHSTTLHYLLPTASARHGELRVQSVQPTTHSGLSNNTGLCTIFNPGHLLTESTELLENAPGSSFLCQAFKALVSSKANLNWSLAWPRLKNKGRIHPRLGFG